MFLQMRRLILAALFALVSAGASAQTEPQFVPFLNNALTGGSGPGAGMLTTGANATSAAFGNLVTAATAASARTSLGLGTGDSPTFTGLTLSSMTQGSVLFAGAGGAVSQDNSNFFWDATNHRLGIRTTAPVSDAAIDIGGNLKVSTSASNLNYIALGDFGSTIANTGMGIVRSDAAGTAAGNILNIEGYNSIYFRLNNSGGTLGSPGAAGMVFTGAGGAGNLGVGLASNTLAPLALLHVGKTAATAQTFNILTDASNYENAYMGDWGVTANVATYGTGKAGTGSTRNIKFLVGGVNKLDYGVTGANTWTIADRLGIGGAPNVPLEITGTDSTPVQFRMTNSTAAKTWQFQNDNSGVFAIGQTGVVTALTFSPTSGNVAFGGTVTLVGGTLLNTSTALTNGAAAQIATMTNGPTAGNPTKWVPINDNGTTRYIPAW